MAIKLEVTIAHLPNGSTTTVRQEEFRRHPDRHAFIVHLEADRAGGPTTTRLRGVLNMSAETLDALPGEGDGEKSRRLSGALAAWLSENVLEDDFVLRAVVQTGLKEGHRIEIFGESNTKRA